MSCREVRQELPGYVRDGNASLTMRRHLMGCESCRSELERYQELLGSLASLRSAAVAPPRELVHALEAIPANAGLAVTVRLRAGEVREHVGRNRRTYLGGAAVAMGVTGAALWRVRARRVATATA